MTKDEFLNALRNDRQFAVDVLTELAPLLRAELSANIERDWDQNIDSVRVEVDWFYVQAPR